MYYVYLLRSKKDKKFYIGSTDNLRKRFMLHNTGDVFSTRNRRPFELIYYESYKSEIDARKREHNLKLRANALYQLKCRLIDSLK